MNYFYLMLAFVVGILLPMQAAINTRLGADLGGQPILAALTSFAVGTLCLFVVSLFIADWSHVLQHASQQPWWRWVGGAMGAIVVFMSIYLTPKIGVTYTMFLFILGQLIMGMLIDNLGLLQMPVRPAYWWKFAGLGIMLVGLVLFVFGEKWFAKS